MSFLAPALIAVLPFALVGFQTPRRLALLALCACAISACASQPDTDQANNVYPVECRGDLSSVDVLVDWRSPDAMEALAVGLGLDGGIGTGPKLLGRWEPASGQLREMIVLDNSLAGWKRTDALRHERCHALWAKLHPETGGRWHR